MNTKKQKAYYLRQQGLTLKEIGHYMGISITSVWLLLNADKQREKIATKRRELRKRQKEERQRLFAQFRRDAYANQNR